MKKVSDVISNVNSPYTDGFIKELVKAFINGGCDYQKMYDSINGSNVNQLIENGTINSLESVIYSRGTHINNGTLERNAEGKSYSVYNTRPVYDYDKHWLYLMSNPDAFDEYRRADVDGSHLLYRFYLNIKGNEKCDFTLRYMEECQKRDLDYKFKFSRKDGRDDEIIVLSTYEHFLENLSIIQDITSTMKLGKIPNLIGKYKNIIGIGEEYYERLYSPTQIRIRLLGAAIIKYICDHEEHAMSLCIDNEEEIVVDLVEQNNFNRKRALRRPDLNCLFSKITEKERAEKNIFDNSDMTEGMFEIKKLGGLVNRLYTENPDNFLNEIKTNVRFIGNNVFGLAKDMVFSSTTEERIKKDKMIDLNQ